jgi:hypothetical protein
VQANKQQKTGRWKLFAVFLVCAAPLIISYLTYYVIKPQGRTNYGEILDPRAYPMPQLATRGLDGKPEALQAYQGKWIMLAADDAACGESCQKKLYYMRQLRMTQGKEMERIERVWLITDEQPLETLIMREYDGTHLLRAKREELQAWLPAAPGATIADHIYLIDPLGNLMMRFPKDADPNRIKKDLSKLLRASSIG